MVGSGPVVFDATVLSNFASSDSIPWLVEQLSDPATVEAVRTELEAGRTAGHGFLDRALSAIDDGIRLLPIEDPIDAGRDRLDLGEAAAMQAACQYEGTLATDDLAARRVALERRLPVTGSVGLLAFGVSGDTLDLETANRWLQRWRDERGYYAPVDRLEDALKDYG